MPKSVVELLVTMLEPFSGRVFDPCFGSGGMFVQSEAFMQSHQGNIDDIKGFCKSASKQEIAKLGFVLTPGRYVGLAENEQKFNFESEFMRLKAELTEEIEEE